MSALNLQNPQNKSWPDFFGLKLDDRIRIEQDAGVQSLVNSGLLLSQELNSFLWIILGLNRKINELLPQDPTLTTQEIDEIFDNVFNNLSQVLGRSEVEKISVTDRQVIKAAVRDKQESSLKSKREDICKQIEEISENIEDINSQFKVDYPKSDLKILSHRILYYCPLCKRLYCSDEFKKKDCQCGEKIDSAKKVIREPIVFISQEVKTFFEKNMWLEHGIQSIFKKAQFETKCGVELLGNSGVMQEIDVLAVHKGENLRIVVECKNRDIKRIDVYKLYGEMTDLGCVGGFIFSTVEKIKSNSVKKLAISKNIRVIEGVLGAKEEELVNKIKSILN